MNWEKQEERYMNEFDPDLPPEHPHNRGTAYQRGLRYNSRIGFYIDEDGCLVRDEFGQELG